MALQTASQFQLTPDIGGALSSGLQLGQQFRQTQLQPQIDELRQKAAAGDPQALTQLAGIAPEEAQKAQQFQLGQQKNQAFAQEQRFNSVVDAALELSSIPTVEGRLAKAKQRKQELITQGLPTQDTDEFIALVESGDVAGANNLIDSAVQAGVQRGRFKAPVKTKDTGFTLSEGQRRFTAAGEEIASVSPKTSKQVEQIEIPPVLLEGLDPAIAPKAEAAFKAAGGGKDGLKAFQKIIDSGTEQQRRLASPAILKSNFPQASRAEQAQLQGAMDAAKTTESGLKAAQKVRVEQKRLKKAAGFQDRAVELLTKILNADELNDVLGSIEGAIDFRLFSDAESEIIADIEEAGNILTADNMDLMTGVLSESDIKILKNLSGGALNRKRTEARFVSDVTELRDKLASQKVVTIDERDQIDNGVIMQDAQGNRARVFKDGRVEEL